MNGTHQTATACGACGVITRFYSDIYRYIDNYLSINDMKVYIYIPFNELVHGSCSYNGGLMVDNQCLIMVDYSDYG